jgi:hypothetical protein
LKEKATSEDEEDVEEAKKDLSDAMWTLEGLTASRVNFDMLHKRVKNEWSSISQCIIGHVVCTPPITIQTPPYGFSNNSAIIKLDKKRFRTAFNGNVMDLSV